MTTNELRKYLNDTYGLGKRPKTLEVDKDTYDNVCTEIENSDQANWHPYVIGGVDWILFKGIELRIKK